MPEPASLFNHWTKQLRVEKSHPHPGGQAIDQETSATEFWVPTSGGASSDVDQNPSGRWRLATRSANPTNRLTYFWRSGSPGLSSRRMLTSPASTQLLPRHHNISHARPFSDEAAVAVEQVLLAIE